MQIKLKIKSLYESSNALYLPTTCSIKVAVAVENDGASAVTSHEKFPDSENPTFLITT